MGLPAGPGLLGCGMASARSARSGSLRPALLWLVVLVLALGVTLSLRFGAVGREPEFVRVMNTGKNYYDQGEATKAIPLFRRAVELEPGRPEAHLNLANAYLLANEPERALSEAQRALEFDANSAAALYVAGCAHLRLRQFEAALKSLQLAHDLDATVPAVSYQLGRAHEALGHLEEAIAAFREAVQLDPRHPVAHYALSQALSRAERKEEAMKEIEAHEKIKAANPAGLSNPATLERCKYTEARAPRQLEKPDPRGISVTFVDATGPAFGSAASHYQGPVGVLDYDHDNRNSLFVAEGTNGFRLLDNQGGVFTPLGPLRPAGGAPYRQCLVGDLNNDHFEDVVVLGETASHAYRFATNGVFREVTASAGLKSLKAVSGALLDLDFTGKLDLLAVLPGGQGLRVLRNLGNLYFKDITITSGVPAHLTGARQVVIDDWNNDDLMDVIVGREGAGPELLVKERGGGLAPTNLPPGRLAGAVIALGDVNNDSRPDLLVGTPDHVDLLLGGVNQFVRLPVAVPQLRSLTLVDYDNDGWLDLLAAGRGVQMWRNLGDGKFKNVTHELGLDALADAVVESVAAADFDGDGDTDLLFCLPGQGLRLWRNDGGNRNHQLKLRLWGNRSNASGLGIRVEAAMGGFHVFRTVSTLPVEIGVGAHTTVDSLTARWVNLAFSFVDVKPDPRTALVVTEPVLPEGSCPYLYAWDGTHFRFVSDILGSAPLGLRITDSLFTDADPREYVWIGDARRFVPRAGAYELRVTEELREVLYLDETKLVAVDHPVGTEVRTTDKLRPSKPFPPSELWTLDHRYPLLRATRLDGAEVTDLLAENDGRVLSPLRLREAQLRGLAEPHGVVLDFGPLPVDRPLVLALTGWLRFGGGMANVGASYDPDLPFPFPTLEVETAPGQWQAVDVVVGAPSGKTKTILVDLAGKLPPHSRRLRLRTAFEIHWDRAALFERRTAADTRVTRIGPDQTDLHWRGFSQFADLPWTVPLTPVYERVFQTPSWYITPVGWCTRYGPVDGLVAREDNALVLLNGGDELTLRFAAQRLPPTPPGMVRDFFFYGVGWDKDSDFHVELGWKVEPLPWHGMDDQAYGRQARPAFPNDGWMRQYNTRWVGQRILQRAAR